MCPRILAGIHIQKVACINLSKDFGNSIQSSVVIEANRRLFLTSHQKHQLENSSVFLKNCKNVSSTPKTKYMWRSYTSH